MTEKYNFLNKDDLFGYKDNQVGYTPDSGTVGFMAEQGLGNDFSSVAPAAPAEEGWFESLGGMEGVSSGMKGLASLGNFGLGIANYFSNKSNFDKMMRFQNANFQQQKNALAVNAGNEMDRLNRLQGVSISPRTQAAYDRVLPRV